MYLYGYWGLSNVDPRWYKVSASLLIVLFFESPSSLRASVGRWGYLRLCSDAQVSNLFQWESLIIWKTYLFFFFPPLLYVYLGLGHWDQNGWWPREMARHVFCGLWVVLDGFLGSRGCSRKSRECSRVFVAQRKL